MNNNVVERFVAYLIAHLTLVGIVGLFVLVFGVFLFGLGMMLRRSEKEVDMGQVYSKESILIDPEKDKELGYLPDGVQVWVPKTYASLLVPMPQRSKLQWNLDLEEGTLILKVLRYFGYPPPLPHGRWRPPRIYEKKITSIQDQDQVVLDSGDYYFEFDKEEQCRRVKATFTLTKYQLEPRHPLAPDLIEFGRIFVTIGVPILAVGITLAMK